MTPEVQYAIEEIKQAFPGHPVDVKPDGQGGAFVVVHDLSLGERYTPDSTWVGFKIDYQYPHADVYPHFVRPDLSRTDGAGFGPGFGQTTWQEMPAWQISRRSNRWNPLRDSAALKLAKVLEWIRSQ